MLGSTGEWRLPVADKWLTFDCYGTVADWNTCMGGALEAVAGKDAGRLLPAYHQAELELEALPDWKPYRQVLTTGPGQAAEHQPNKLSSDCDETFFRARPDLHGLHGSWPALAALPQQGC